MTQVHIIAAKRTANASFQGAYKDIPATRLSALCTASAMDQSGIAKSSVDEVIMGQVLSAGAGMNPARSMSYGLGINCPSYTINHVCGSSMSAIISACKSIMLGSNCVLAGGFENMTLAPHTANLRLGKKLGNMSFKDSILTDGLMCSIENIHMGETAENLAIKYNLTRQMQDEFAYNSHKKAQKSYEQGFFKTQIVPIKVGNEIIHKDEPIRSDIDMATLRLLRPAFKDGKTATAGNSSPISDGACSTILASSDFIERNNLKSLGRIVSWGTASVDPKIMGIGASAAAKLALKSANWKIEDLDLIESNEAFAAQALAVNIEMAWDSEIVNTSGGSIAIGHPLAVSGARILTNLLYGLIHKGGLSSGKKRGLATLCIGGGQGVSMCIEVGHEVSI